MGLTIASVTELREQADRLDKAKASPGAGEPVLDILREYPTPSFAESCVPGAIWQLADAFSAASGFDRNGLVMAATVAAAAAVDDRYRLAVRPASGWFESARLWAVVIGTPSAGKSPTLRAATDPIKEIHREQFARWAKDNEGADPKAEGAEPRPALFTSDATIEKMAEMLRDNHRGLFMLTEEFASWIGGIDAYKDGAGTKGRGEWLQLYDGGPHQVDRVNRGSFFVPNWSCGVLAAATPAGLQSHLKQLPDDGLIHRFMPVMMGKPGRESDRSARDALDAWSRRLRQVFEATTREDRAPTLRLTAPAALLFDAERTAIRDALDPLSDVSPGLSSHVGKHPGMIARVALTFHAIDQRQGDAIEPDTMQAAIDFMRVVRKHAAALFLGVLGRSSSLDLARNVARSILAGGFEDVGRNTFLQHCKPWRSAAEGQQRQAVQLLTDAGWLIPDDEARAYGGWPTSRWFVRPEVHARFAEHGERHQARRAAIRSALGGEDAESL